MTVHKHFSSQTPHTVLIVKHKSAVLTDVGHTHTELTGITIRSHSRHQRLSEYQNTAITLVD